MTNQTDPTSIPTLPAYDEPTLDQSFAVLAEEVRTTAAGADAEAFRLLWLGRKQGRLKLISEAWLKQAPAEARKPLGIRFNQLKQQIEQSLEAPAAKIAAAQGLDISLPGLTRTPGIPHPLLTAMDRVVEVFHHLGYSTQLGPQVESDFYNFEALNFPENHPARDTQDTLQVAHQQSKPSRDRLLMRTHTSPVQIRTMVSQAPPLRIVIPGKVHRNDAADATHSPIFHQVEGLCVDTNVTFSDLKGTLDHAMRALFGSAVKTRFFPSFFPFTEPSADVQISCIFCGGKGCRKCKHSGWIELLGCGMVDPAVFQAVTEERRRLGLDPSPYDPARISGFAFGMGVERIAMILHGVSDIGQFYSGDMRFLEQFS
ncbi:phenylalanine--tRNA ligase subunit alpha [Granulicella tundricola]|uniref:Phenylalanine--tRNA ligase alpha subunit n=1 Tax=Granulicella tundricola (strain ATCC BAA-1859 / DSM 23138 / MP5ACTX9) TaxID=1198114 RepID=E8WVC4_GRATM|nr:phenylalanine--tRNA ligase subunit alpha [Granulicella tundricola]ADW67299.1 phenylalanyl-tRNA synthetase, alpha subunit [Granulicella tundricola MP5ACTX9]